MSVSFQQRLDELKSELETMRQDKTLLQEKLLRAQSHQGSETELRNQEQELKFLREQIKRLERLSRQREADLKQEMSKSRGLNTRLVAAESRANEVQKKHEESKRNYLRIRDERERLRGELEQARGGGTSTGGVSASEAVGHVEMAAQKSKGAAVNGASTSLSDIQAKYESLKTKLKVSLLRWFRSALGRAIRIFSAVLQITKVEVFVF